VSAAKSAPVGTTKRRASDDSDYKERKPRARRLSLTTGASQSNVPLVQHYNEKSDEEDTKMISFLSDLSVVMDSHLGTLKILSLRLMSVEDTVRKLEEEVKMRSVEDVY